MLAQRRHGRAHGRTRRQAVVDENDRTVAHLGWRAGAAINAFAPLELLFFSRRNRIDHSVAQRQWHHDVLVHHAYAARCDRAHRKLVVTGNAQLADDEDVERCLERVGDLECDRHTATRQRQDEHVMAIGVFRQ